MSKKAPLIPDLLRRYCDAVVVGDATEARQVVDEAVARGVPPRSVYLSILVESQRVVGTLWHQGKLSVALEHVASNITISEMGRIRGVLKRRPSLGKRAVVSCVQGDNHLIGARVIADFLYFDGWDVDFLGIDTPTEELKQFVKDRKSDLVGLSCSTTDLLTVLQDAAKGVKEVDPRIRVLAGGAAISQDRAAQLKGDGIDEVGFSVDDSCDKARQLVGLPLVATNLEQVLKEIGERLTFHRKARRFSQQQVAELSGLDRAYISAVEHGKHNLTLGALIKLADALEVGIEEVILGGASDNGPKSKA